ncbi:hypothetical protein [Nannocystis sp.]|uniref:hypothetical protein n=1 Tax=Nannocystis sp. TaxID=1962667 RepID=UPI0024244C14|nr:hypothetical protein [Nannocystis sp.]MBK7826481.1 hypothetical protein [Nannocystis sp.]MBK9758000.1 hypothetical protein [Nannocystis sp.]
MLARLHLALLALSLSACAAHEAPVSSTSRELEKPPPETTTPHANLKIAIASVTLEQNCPDPPEPVVPASTTAAEAPAQPAPGELGSPMPPQAGAPLARAKRSADAGPWQPPCNQSTMQLALSNAGDAPGTLTIKAIRLLDAASKKPLGTLNARRPSLWSDTGSYQKWDQQILPGATLKTSYSLDEPAWPDVQTQLGSANLYTTPFLLELEVAVDGAVQTVRSSEFLRQEVHMIVT